MVRVWHLRGVDGVAVSPLPQLASAQSWQSEVATVDRMVLAFGVVVLAVLTWNTVVVTLARLRASH